MKAGKNTPETVLAFIEAHLDAGDLPDPVELARELGYTPVGFRKLQERHGKNLAKHLAGLKRKRDVGNEPRLLPKNAGDYVHSPFAALTRGDELGPELEAVPEDYQNVLEMKAESQADKRRAEERLRREQHSLETRLSIAKKVAAMKSIDISMHERAIERRLLELERMLAERPIQKAA